LKDIFREVEAFLNKYEDFLRITRLSEDIFRVMEEIEILFIGPITSKVIRVRIMEASA
jgi:hypothetical protein